MTATHKCGCMAVLGLLELVSKRYHYDCDRCTRANARRHCRFLRLARFTKYMPLPRPSAMMECNAQFFACFPQDRKTSDKIDTETGFLPLFTDMPCPECKKNCTICSKGCLRNAQPPYVRSLDVPPERVPFLAS